HSAPSMLGITPRAVGSWPINCGRNTMAPPINSSRYIARSTYSRARETSLSAGNAADGETLATLKVISNLQSLQVRQTGALRQRNLVEIPEGRPAGRRALR